MAEIVIYTGSGCPYCDRAKRLLQSKGARYTEVNIEESPEREAEMIEKVLPYEEGEKPVGLRSLGRMLLSIGTDPVTTAVATR